MTMPSYLKDDKRAKAVFGKVKKHLKESGRLETVDAEMVAAYAVATADFERLSIEITKRGATVIDHNNMARRHPNVIMRKQASDLMVQMAKTLGIDRCYREKGREQKTSLGKSTDKIGRLRKVG